MTASFYHPPRLTLPERWHQRLLHRKRVRCVLATIAAYEEEITTILDHADRDVSDAPADLERLHHAEERLAFWRGRLAELHGAHK